MISLEKLAETTSAGIIPNSKASVGSFGSVKHIEKYNVYSMDENEREKKKDER